MKHILNSSLFAVLLLLVRTTGLSQNNLYISSGGNLFITNNAIVYIDGLVFKPSVDYNITGLNSVTRDATANPPPSTSYIQRVYHLLSTLPAYSGDITFYYQDAELNGLNENTLTLNVNDGSTWNAYVPTARDAANNFVTKEGLTNISIKDATLASSSAPLPVTLLSFTAEIIRCAAHLKWTTATEQNSRHFEVQHSTDGVNFTVTGIVLSSGNSNSEKHYSFSDLSTVNSQLSTVFYRLRLVDIDGSSKFSRVITLTSNCSNSLITLFPNPATNSIVISGLSGVNHLQLLNNAGQVLTTFKTTNNSSVTINLVNIRAGTYILKVIKANKVIENFKVIKQ